MRKNLMQKTALTGIVLFGVALSAARPALAQDNSVKATVDTDDAFSIAQDTRERLSPVIEQSLDFRLSWLV